MISFFFNKKNKKKDNIKEEFKTFWDDIKSFYCTTELKKERKDYIDVQMEKYGYIRLSHQKALSDLTPEETIYALLQKFKLNKTFNNQDFSFDRKTIHPAVRFGYNDSGWMQKEQHNIKLINLAALGDGNVSEKPARFIDMLKQIVTLPAGNPEKGILGTTVYLIPFHPREFGCAYLPTSSDVSSNIEDKEITEKLGIDKKMQVKLFIQIAQLAGHSVIYDILPQTGRFSKGILSHPYAARWFDIKQLIKDYKDLAGRVAETLYKDNDKDDVDVVKHVFKSNLSGGSDDLNENYKDLYKRFSDLMLKEQMRLSQQMLSKIQQEEIVERVKDIILLTNDKKEITCEDDITKQPQTIQNLIDAGLWSAPGGAWCSCGVPVFIKMSECGSYPTFKHFDVEGNDVTHFANLDCQTPYYFVYLENGSFNNKVVDYFIDYMKQMQAEYGFDGYRVDHIDHIVDKFSETDGVPISYRAPRKVLKKLNTEMKALTPHFAVLAEYMLWDNFYKEYHQDMNFDVLWGNDIISQSSKKASVIMDDNNYLSNYNTQLPSGKTPLSILKTYNNQDGEFGAIDQYPGQLGEHGALFKWFKYKFLVGGKDAQRPVLFIDGDESFTQTGIENTIGNEISMKRNNDENFYNQFVAINDFALHLEQTLNGESQIISEDDDGFVSWLVSKDPLKESLLIVANQNAPTEKIHTTDENGNTINEIIEGKSVFDKLVKLPCDYKIISQFVYNVKDKCFLEKEFTRKNSIKFTEIHPSKFFIYKVLR